jgi:hypothetical protein
VSYAITTNHVPRDLIDGALLSDEERRQFGHYDWPAVDEGSESAKFFRYRGRTYDLADFERVDEGGELAAAGWHGALAESVWSAVVIRLTEDRGVVVGYAIARDGAA